MDSCDTIKNDNETDKQVEQGKIEYRVSNVSYLFPTFWIRRAICADNEVDRFLLDYGYNFLFYIGSIFWLIYLLVS